MDRNEIFRSNDRLPPCYGPFMGYVHYTFNDESYENWMSVWFDPESGWRIPFPISHGTKIKVSRWTHAIDLGEEDALNHI